MSETIRFGTAGTSDSFSVMGYKTSMDVPEYTARMGLNAFEYQCGRGVRLGLDKAEKMARLAQPKDILFSVHAPYYISMSSMEEDKRLNSIDYILQSCALVKALGDDRAKNFHVHFSRIEFTNGGEKRHWTFAETQFGPEPAPLMELFAERKVSPVVICESAGTQAEDAQWMQDCYKAALE